MTLPGVGPEHALNLEAISFPPQCQRGWRSFTSQMAPPSNPVGLGGELHQANDRYSTVRRVSGVWGPAADHQEARSHRLT